MQPGKKKPNRDELFWKALAVVSVIVSIASLVLTIMGAAG